MRHYKILLIATLIFYHLSAFGQTSAKSTALLKQEGMEHASFSYIVEDISTGKVMTSFQPDLQVTPASVLKLITTATALELLGEDYRYPTTVLYDGYIENGILNGNLYIKGSGDPTLGSTHFEPNSKNFIDEWRNAILQLGIKTIKGSIIADESIFDTEGISMKWVREDLGSYYGAGSYGISFHDNLYSLYLNSSSIGTRPKIVQTDPVIKLDFHNYLKTANVRTDSCYIVGMPFSTERYLYGVVPANRQKYRLKGDIPDPALFLAKYFQQILKNSGITIQKGASCYRILQERNLWKPGKQTKIITTYSPTLKQIVEKTNHVSHNLFADALLKTIGLRYSNGRKNILSSFGKGLEVLKDYWNKKGLDISSLTMVDGSGLAPANKVTANLLNDLLIYMSKSKHASSFINSLPKAGIEGSVRNFMKETPLTGKVFLKSGSMSGVKCYAGYVKNQNKTFSIVVLTNNYTMNGRSLNKRLEKFIISLFNYK